MVVGKENIELVAENGSEVYIVLKSIGEILDLGFLMRQQIYSPDLESQQGHVYPRIKLRSSQNPTSQEQMALGSNFV